MSAAIVVGVIGAGTMGAGIAQVAAAAGHRVLLHDARPGAAAGAIAQITAGLARRVQDGKLAPAEAEALAARLEAVDELARLAPCGLVVEAIVEQLEAKRSLFAALEAVVADDCMLASNTSSLSVTAIARDLMRRGRCLGLHFFNPVPAMKLVEVISGLATEPAVAARAAALAKGWGKTPVPAANTPGFIVNRIARPYYAEALLLLEQRRATPTQIDACLRGAGFRMGPCELMDLIGHDVNYAVTESVFAANYGDRRFLPSRLQRELVDGGRLGRKIGQGFYAYPQPLASTAADAEAASKPALPASLRFALEGEGAWAATIKDALEAAGARLERLESGAGLRLDLADDGASVRLQLCDGRPAAQIAADSGAADVAVFDWPLAQPDGGALAIAFAPHCAPSARRLALETLRALGHAPVEIEDAPGLCVARTIAMLINEAADAVDQGVCDEAGANTAMRLGTNWPAGPFEWLQRIGAAPVVTLLDRLQALTRSERYRASPLLLRQLWSASAPG